LNFQLRNDLRGLIFVLVGPGGVGKSTLMKAVMPRLQNLRQLPTVTTRSPRAGEEHGRERFFVAPDEFRRMIDDHELVEYEEVTPGKYYGVPRRYLEQALRNGQDLIADIEYAGASKVRQNYPENTVLIFVAPPEPDVLAERMRVRGETEQGIADRLARVQREMPFQNACKYSIVNEVVEHAMDELSRVIQAEQAARDTRWEEAEAEAASARSTQTMRRIQTSS
jgi:guanylate kinase